MSILEEIHSEKDIVVLLVSDDELSHQASSSLSVMSGKLVSYGFGVHTILVSPDTSMIPEFSAVRVPQLRFFIRGKKVSSLLGVFSEHDINEVLRTLSSARSTAI